MPVVTRLVGLHKALAGITSPGHRGHDAIPLRHKPAANRTSVAGALEMGRKVAELARRVNDQNTLAINLDDALARTGLLRGSLTGSRMAAGRLSSGSDIAAGRRAPSITRPIDKERVSPCWWCNFCPAPLPTGQISPIKASLELLMPVMELLFLLELGAVTPNVVDG